MANEELKRQNVDKALGTACTCFLKHGVEFVTREMISRESGISRATLGRYWVDKTDCVIKTTEWFGKHMQEIFNEQCPDEMWKNKSGLEQLKCFMEWCRNLYIEDPRLFALYMELKVYLHRSEAKLNGQEKQLTRALGFQPFVKRIFIEGMSDKSLMIHFSLNDEVDFFGDAFFGYLANLAFQSNISADEAREDINRYTERMLSIYRG